MNEAVRRTSVAVLLTLFGVVCSALATVPALFVPSGAFTRFLVLFAFAELGFALAAVVFLLATGRGVGYVRLRWLDRRAVWLVVAGTVALFAYRFVVVFAARAVGVPVAGSSVTDLADSSPQSTLLAFVPLSVLVIGPAEELLFRGVVQQYLAEGISRAGAIVLASVLFALVHVPTVLLADTDPLAVTVSVGVLFGLSLLLGDCYARTENLLVPALVHGFYDALLFATAYVVGTGNVPV